MNTAAAHPLVTQLGELLLPLLHEHARDLAAAIKGVRSTVQAQPIGSNTHYQGFQFSLSCFAPNQSPASEEEVSFLVEVCHLDQAPRLVGEVVWEQGQVETSLRPQCSSSNDWPFVTPELVAELQLRLPELLARHRQAVLRGRPSEA